MDSEHIKASPMRVQPGSHIKHMWIESITYCGLMTREVILSCLFFCHHKPTRNPHGNHVFFRDLDGYSQKTHLALCQFFDQKTDFSLVLASIHPAEKPKWLQAFKRNRPFWSLFMEKWNQDVNWLVVWNNFYFSIYWE